MLHEFQQEGSATQQTFFLHTDSAVSKPIDARGGAVLLSLGSSQSVGRRPGSKCGEARPVQSDTESSA